ncbi:hypothetical protein [Bartonella vinsonii]|uniref:hypothetical protein n=1 Tax=Bartonella vinsonii TaxID=33047 RepID=UPI0012DE901A|nr:hypothetical protein [Bartonella vinsonii]
MVLCLPVWTWALLDNIPSCDASSGQAVFPIGAVLAIKTPISVVLSFYSDIKTSRPSFAHRLLHNATIMIEGFILFEGEVFDAVSAFYPPL